MRGLKKGHIACFSVSSLLFIAFVVLVFTWSTIFHIILKSSLSLSSKSRSYSMWVETPLPMYLDIYAFNFTNALEFANNPKVKPIYKEIGPFVFREVHDRVNISWNADGSISYNQTRNWTFVPELSMDLGTPITNLDVITLGVAHATRYVPKTEKMIVDGLLRITSKLYVTKPAREWLFDGMNLPLLQILNNHYIKKYVPFPIPDKFGFFYQRNLSAAYDGRFTIFSGVNDLSQLGNMKTWNGQNKTNFFQGYCAMVNGSSGEIFPPLHQDQNEFTLFISDVCSSLTLKYKEDEIINDVRGKKFIGDASMFDNGQNMTERACFCEGECQPAGVRNLTRCRQGAPVFVSFPHFYLADPSYLTKIDGLVPNKTLHEFQLTIDPISGIPLDVRASLQVNVLLQSDSEYKIYKNMPKTYMPMLWFSQRAHVTQPISAEAKMLSSLQSYPIMCFGAAAVLCLSIVIILTGLAISSKEEEEPLVGAEVEHLQDDHQYAVDS